MSTAGWVVNSAINCGGWLHNDSRNDELQWSMTVMRSTHCSHFLGVTKHRIRYIGHIGSNYILGRALPLHRPHPSWAGLNCLTNTDPNLLPFTTLYWVMSSNSIIWTPMCPMHPMYPMQCFVAPTLFSMTDRCGLFWLQIAQLSLLMVHRYHANWAISIGYSTE